MSSRSRFSSPGSAASRLHDPDQPFVLGLYRREDLAPGDGGRQRPAVVLDLQRHLPGGTERIEPAPEPVEQDLLGSRMVQRVESRLAHEGAGDRADPCLLERGQAEALGDLDVPSANTFGGGYRGEHRDVQMQVQVQ